MPRRLTFVTIERSRLALVSQLALVTALALYAGVFVAMWPATVIALLGGGWCVWCYRSADASLQLRFQRESDGLRWEKNISGAWCPVQCRTRRLSPLICALELDGRCHWLWPDCADADSRRHLREALGEQLEDASRKP